MSLYIALLSITIFSGRLMVILANAMSQLLSNYDDLEEMPIAISAMSQCQCGHSPKIKKENPTMLSKYQEVGSSVLFLLVSLLGVTVIFYETLAVALILTVWFGPSIGRLKIYLLYARFRLVSIPDEFDCCFVPPLPPVPAIQPQYGGVPVYPGSALPNINIVPPLMAPPPTTTTASYSIPSPTTPQIAYPQIAAPPTRSTQPSTRGFFSCLFSTTPASTPTTSTSQR